MKHRIHSEDTTIGFQIAPMIDVVFVIMLFFMVMTGTMKVEHELKTQLPKWRDPTQVVKVPAEEITIGIFEDGTVTLNEEAFDSPNDKRMPTLTRTLQKLAASSGQQKLLVTIRAEEQASYERIIDVLNSLHKTQIQNVTFTVGNEP